MFARTPTVYIHARAALAFALASALFAACPNAVADLATCALASPDRPTFSVVSTADPYSDRSEDSGTDETAPGNADAAASAAPSDGPYLVHPSARPGEALDVLSGSVHDGADAIVYKLDGTDTQSWVLDRRDDVPGIKGAYAIVNVKTGRLLAVDLASVEGDDVEDEGEDKDKDASEPSLPKTFGALAPPRSAVEQPELDLDGADVCQQVDHELTPWVTDEEKLAQRWTVTPVGDETFRISPVLDEKSALTVVAREGDRTYADARLVRTVSARFADAKWTFEKSSVSTVETAMIASAQDYRSDTDFLVMVDITNHYLGVFEGKEGNWDLVRYCSCGNGAYDTPSPVGTFTMGDKGYYFDSEDGARVFYFSRIWGEYYIHSTLYWPWSEEPEYTMDPTLGAYESHGCIRVDLADAYYVHKYVPTGTTIVLYQ